MADWLSVGAGASAGLERLLAQRLLEQKLAQQQDEAQRDYELRKQEMEQRAADRQAQQERQIQIDAANKANWDAENQNRIDTMQNNQADRMARFTPPGTEMDPASAGVLRKGGLGSLLDDQVGPEGIGVGPMQGGPGTLKARPIGPDIPTRSVFRGVYKAPPPSKLLSPEEVDQRLQMADAEARITARYRPAPSSGGSAGTMPPEVPVLYKPPDATEARQFISGGTLTNKALWENSVDYLLTGSVKYNPRAADPRMRTNFAAIDNTAAGMVQNGSSLPELRAQFKSLSGAMQGTVKNYINTKAFVDSATLGIAQAESMSEQYPRFTAPKANEMKRWIDRNIKGDPSLSAFEVFVFNTARDYAKATSGSAGSIQQMTDAQIKASEMLLNSAQNKPMFLSALSSMKQDMANVLSTQRNAIATVNRSIIGLTDQTIGAPEGADFVQTSQGPGPNKAPQATTPARKRYDINGNLIKD